MDTGVCGLSGLSGFDDDFEHEIVATAIKTVNSKDSFSFYTGLMFLNMQSFKPYTLKTTFPVMNCKN